MRIPKKVARDRKKKPATRKLPKREDRFDQVLSDAFDTGSIVLIHVLGECYGGVPQRSPEGSWSLAVQDDEAQSGTLYFDLEDVEMLFVPEEPTPPPKVLH